MGFTGTFPSGQLPPPVLPGERSLPQAMQLVMTPLDIIGEMSGLSSHTQSPAAAAPAANAATTARRGMARYGGTTSAPLGANAPPAAAAPTGQTQLLGQ